MAGIWAQMWEFVLLSCVGVFLAGIFHFHQRVIISSSIKGWVLWIIDGAFWLLAALVTFISLLAINQGDMRFYVILAMAVGAVLYYFWLRPRTNRYVNDAARMTSTAVRRLARKVLYPGLVVRNYLMGLKTDKDKKGD